MDKVTYFLTFALACAITALVLKQCNPERVTNTQVVDSLKLEVTRALRLQREYAAEAEKAYQRGLEAEKAKVVIRTIYRRDTAINHRLRKYLKDSLIKAMFTEDPTMDSSMFSVEVADGVLDLNSENHMLKAETKQDSTTIQELKQAYIKIDSACKACGSALHAQTEITKMVEKEVKKQKKLKWLFAILSAIGFAI